MRSFGVARTIEWMGEGGPEGLLGIVIRRSICLSFGILVPALGVSYCIQCLLEPGGADTPTIACLISRVQSSRRCGMLNTVPAEDPGTSHLGIVIDRNLGQLTLL